MKPVTFLKGLFDNSLCRFFLISPLHFLHLRFFIIFFRDLDFVSRRFYFMGFLIFPSKNSHLQLFTSVKLQNRTQYFRFYVVEIKMSPRRDGAKRSFATAFGAQRQNGGLASEASPRRETRSKGFGLLI